MKNRLIKPALLLITLMSGTAIASPLDDLRSAAINELERGLRLQLAGVDVAVSEAQLIDQIQQQHIALKKIRTQARKSKAQDALLNGQRLTD